MSQISNRAISRQPADQTASVANTAQAQTEAQTEVRARSPLAGRSATQDKPVSRLGRFKQALSKLFNFRTAQPGASTARVLTRTELTKSERHGLEVEKLTESPEKFASYVREKSTSPEQTKGFEGWPRVVAQATVSMLAIAKGIETKPAKDQTTPRALSEKLGNLTKIQTAIENQVERMNHVQNQLVSGSPQEKKDIKAFAGNHKLGENALLDASLTHLSRVYTTVTTEMNTIRDQLSEDLINNDEYAEGTVYIGKPDIHGEKERNLSRLTLVNNSLIENKAANRAIQRLAAELRGGDPVLTEQYGEHAEAVEALAKDPDLNARTDKLITAKKAMENGEEGMDKFDDDIGLNDPGTKINKKKEVATLKENMTGAAELPLFNKKLSESAMVHAFIDRGFEEAKLPPQMGELYRARFNFFKNNQLNIQPWEAMSRKIIMPPTSEEGKHSILTHNITPASHIGAKEADFHTPYHDDKLEGVNCADRLRTGHAWNLAASESKNEEGQVIYRHARHGVIDAYHVTGKILNSSPDDVLKPIASKHLNDNPQWQTHMAENSVGGVTTSSTVRQIQTNPQSAELAASLARPAMNRVAALETVKAMVISNPQKYQLALQRGEVDIEANSVSLLTPDKFRKSANGNERMMLDNQVKALNALAAESPLTIKLAGENADDVKEVKVNFKVNTFNFGVNEGAVVTFGKVVTASNPLRRWAAGWNDVQPMNQKSLDSLMGKNGKGGLLQQKTLEWQNQLENLRGASQRQSRAPSAEETRLQKNMTAARELGSQIQQIWQTKSYLREGTDPYKMVTRIAVLSHLLGDETMVNCKSGKDRTGEIEVATAQLAHHIDQNNGHPPAPDQAPDKHSRAIHGMLALNMGNLEMQKYNTGLPGYKTQIDSLKKQFENENDQLIHLGFSKRVKS